MKRSILINESELDEVLEIIRRCIMNYNYVPPMDTLIIKTPNYCCVQFDTRNDVWYEILLTFEKHGICLLPEIAWH